MASGLCTWVMARVVKFLVLHPGREAETTGKETERRRRKVYVGQKGDSMGAGGSCPRSFFLFFFCILHFVVV